MDDRLNLRPDDAAALLVRHLPLGSPGLTNGVPVCQLAQTDYVLGYSVDYHLPFWAAFTIEKVCTP